MFLNNINMEANMNNADERFGMGWLPDYPDFRDYTEGHKEVNKVIAPTGKLDN